ncbi:MAG: radical SAM protein, partial [Thermodesulfobacteriota bacterium]
MSFGIYIHIPYCVTKCPYCDFNSYGVGGRFPEKEYTESILHELEFYRSEIQGARLSSIFFGGGTPSLFDPRSIEKIISKIYQITCPVDNLEVSLEVNPKTADLEKLKGLRSAGINRISVGIQSFSKRKL